MVYLEQYSLGINLETKRKRNISPEMAELDNKLFDFVKLAQEKYHVTQDGKTQDGKNPSVEVETEETKETNGLVY